ncbi:MAG: DUF721 domain-containing protein [Planctomycetota bacterium]
MRGLRPRPYGVNRGAARPVREVMGRLLQAPAFSQRMRNEGISRAWREVVGEEVANHTRVAAVRSGVLCIEVSGAAWLHELAAFHKESILEEMRKRVKRPYIQDIRFRQHGERARGN